MHGCLYTRIVALLIQVNTRGFHWFNIWLPLTSKVYPVHRCEFIIFSSCWCNCCKLWLYRRGILVGFNDLLERLLVLVLEWSQDGPAHCQTISVASSRSPKTHFQNKDLISPKKLIWWVCELQNHSKQCKSVCKIW